jgi:hypothetical protein
VPRPKQRPCTQPWHEQARRLSAEGKGTREIALIVGRAYSNVAYFLNPKSYENRKARDRQRYREDEAYRAKRCTWVRTDGQPLGAPRPRTRSRRALRHRQPTMPWHHEAITLWADGLTFRDIAARVGKSTTSVGRFLDADQYHRFRMEVSESRRQRYKLDEQYREAGKAAALARYYRRVHGLQQPPHP